MLTTAQIRRRRVSSASAGGHSILDPSALGNLAAWYSARTLSSLWQDSGRTAPITAQGETVGAWDDLSGNSRHLTQGTGSAEPTYRTGDIQGRPSLLFDGTDFLSSTEAWVATVFGGVDLPFSVLMVLMQTDLTGIQSVCNLGRNAANGYRAFRSNGGTPQLTSTPDGGGAVSNTATTGFITVSTPLVLGMRYDGVNAELFNNFTRIYGPTASLAVGSTVSADRIGVGALVRNTNANFYIGHIAEVVVCTTMTEAERMGVTSYLRRAYGL